MCLCVQVVTSTEQSLSTSSHVSEKPKLLTSPGLNHQLLSHMLQSFLPLVHTEEGKSHMFKSLLTLAQNEEDMKVKRPCPKHTQFRLAFAILPIFFEKCRWSGFLQEQHWWFSGRILACHAGGPGSIPGQCSTCFSSCSFSQRGPAVLREDTSGLYCCGQGQQHAQ